MFGKIRENKKIKLYGLVLRDTPKRYLTICNSIDQCKEFLELLFRYDLKEHYEAWCAIREYDPKDMASWSKYYLTSVTPEEKNKYAIVPMTFAWKDIVGVIRMFGGCVPIGASFDTKGEYDRLTDLLEKEKQFRNLFAQAGIKEPEEKKKEFDA